MYFLPGNLFKELIGIDSYLILFCFSILTKKYTIWQVVRRWHHQLTHLHIFIDWSRNVLWKFAKLENVLSTLNFQAIFIRFSLVCLKFFTLYSEINSNRFRITHLISYFWNWNTITNLNGSWKWSPFRGGSSFFDPKTMRSIVHEPRSGELIFFAILNPRKFSWHLLTQWRP